MTDAVDPSSLLNEILYIVNKEVKVYKDRVQKEALSYEEAQVLVRYANLLDDLLRQKKDELEREKKSLSKMSTQELIQKYQEMLSAKR